ncbi:unnamed protein product [Linum trigynum]|uniref:RNase H type-1 domain-containing protein n=1 Tax=Linum trigynum TaxID=586398 RepID=A0AAV2GR93_9ROSI
MGETNDELVQRECRCSNSQDGGTGFGLVIRDEIGNCRLAAVHRTRTEWPPKLAEAKALLWESRISIAHQFSPILMELDCKPLIGKLYWEERSETEIETICGEIRDPRRDEEHLNWRFWARNGNGATHLMARIDCRW